MVGAGRREVGLFCGLLSGFKINSWVDGRFFTACLVKASLTAVLTVNASEAAHCTGDVDWPLLHLLTYRSASSWVSNACHSAPG